MSKDIVGYSWFSGNIEFYNDPKYREANRKFYECVSLLKELGMTHKQALDWVVGWGYDENSTEE